MATWYFENLIVLSIMLMEWVVHFIEDHLFDVNDELKEIYVCLMIDITLSKFISVHNYLFPTFINQVWELALFNGLEF